MMLDTEQQAAPRLNLIVGRNRTGKTWLLDGIWRWLTDGVWCKPGLQDPRWGDRTDDDIVLYIHETEVRVFGPRGGRDAMQRRGPFSRGFAPDNYVREVLADGAWRRCVVLIDEVEAHLHPERQRTALRGVLEVDGGLQVFATTHSPLVLASAEPLWCEHSDKLWRCENPADGRYDLHEQPWAMQGDVSAWLVSDVFGLRQARSLDAELAIEHAQAWMSDEADSIPEDRRSAAALTAELKRVLASHDPFWARWVVTANK